VPFTSPMTWVSGSILTAAQLNTYVGANIVYLKGETDAYDAHAAAGAAVHGLPAGVYVAGYRGASGKWMDAGTIEITTGSSGGALNFDHPGGTIVSFSAAYSATPYVFTNLLSSTDIYAVTQAYSVSTGSFGLRVFTKNSPETRNCAWLAIGS
jgi:hypothetical protein